MLPPPGARRRFAGIQDLITHLNAVGSRSLAAIGSKSQKAKLQDDEKMVTLQVGKSVFEGAPRNMRTELWMSSLQRKGIGVAASQKYEDMLLSPVGDEAASDIDKDLGRTFPSTKRFAAAEGQEALRRVLRAYAALDPEVGYCQGMNFVAGLLLMYLPERHAFGGLVVLMQDRGLRKYYSTEMLLIQTHLWQLGRLMPTRLCTHLESIGVLPLLYGASWLMTCFSADFPASFSARIMDVIMADKMDQALLKAAVALLKRCEPQLLQMSDMEDALHLLKLELPAWEEPLLHDVLTEAFSKPWSSRQLQLLGSLEGAETVAEALTRVQRANLAASMDSLSSADVAADEAPGLLSPGGGGYASGGSSSSRAATPAPPSPAAAAAAAGSGGGAGGGGSSSGGAAVLPLFPPPPSPKRPSSTGAASAGPISPASSRCVSRAASQSGAAAAAAASAVPAVHDVPAAAAADAWHAANGSNAHHVQHGLSHLAPLQPVQQQQQLDMIDMSSPRASMALPAVAAGSETMKAAGQQQQQHDPHSSAWDPFGLADPPPQQQAHSSSGRQSPPALQQQHGQAQQLGGSTAGDALRQQLQDLSFSQLPSPVAAPQHKQQHKQQPSLTEDDWGDFLSPHAAK